MKQKKGLKLKLRTKDKKRYKGFSIEEVLTVIVIIGILGTITLSYISGARASARDVQRVTDIDSIHTALEMYHGDNGVYPATLPTGDILSGPNNKVYLSKIPSNPMPSDDGNCPSNTNYAYRPSNDFTSYELDYCLGARKNDLAAGHHMAIPAGPHAGTFVSVVIYHSGQLTSYYNGDDAFHDGLEKEYSTNCGTDTVIDSTSGLCWQKYDQSARNWEVALAYCDTLDLGGHTDWHLPSGLEGISMFDYSCAEPSSSCYANFQNSALGWGNTQNHGYLWSSTTRPTNTANAYEIYTGDGTLGAYAAKTAAKTVRCVRVLQSEETIPYNTGQTISYGTADDADINGTPKSYTDNGCGTDTVLDDISGLCWQKHDQAKRPWEDAISYCNTLNLGGYADWHLPSLPEGLTLFDYSCIAANDSCYANFQNSALVWDDTFQGKYPWLSTTRADNPVVAFGLNFYSGNLALGSPKTTSWRVRCVR